ncbi:phospholipid phosphatase 2-like isoform X1 [Oncorhynchus tshawytscha]|uniref:Phospholipid phosphatase 2a n=1 Tax=Oncorhynchus tshawytscha TaxID=74940 RepID=A0AAZ3PCG8_ONCTS|nr:phospholipid phosphatase 2-like isoform X1 [Oncorhynchus tshawytscha]
MTELPVHKKNMLILVDVLCVFFAALPSAVLTLMFSPYQRGIYCDDESIRYPYRRDTISHRAMAAVTIPSSIVIITTGEAYLVYSKRLHSNSNFNQYMSALYKVVGTFLFGAAVSQSLTDLAKFTIGRPRPNFLSVCNPTVCSGYMLQLNCTGNPRNVTESRLSFYSGHSAFGMYSMLFLALYVQARMQGKWTRLVRPTVQFFLVAFALYVGYTRVSDYKHHWSDVLVGLLQGTLIAVLNVCYVSDFFKLRPPPRRPRSEAAEDEHLEAKPGLDPDTQLHNNHYDYTTTSARTQTNNYTTTTATTQQPLHNNHGNRGEVA